MENAELIIYIVKLVLSGITAFLSVILWSITRKSYCASLACGFIFAYIEQVFNMLVDLGFLVVNNVQIWSVSIIPLVFSVMPFVFFITGLIIFIVRKK